MSNEGSKSYIYQSFKDIELSFTLLKENWHPFVLVELIGILALFVYTVIDNLILLPGKTFIFESHKLPVSPRDITLNNQPNMVLTQQTPHQFLLFTIFQPFIAIISIVLFYAFITTAFGFANDIINSGDQFTEFTNSFRYFKKYFFEYSFITLLILYIPIIFFPHDQLTPFIDIPFSTGLINYTEIFNAYIIFLAQFLLFILLNLVFVGITNGKSLGESFKHNFQIVISNPKRILTSWGLTLALISIPVIVLIALISLVMKLFFPVTFLMNFFIITLESSMLILCFPLMALVSTRIYSTTC